MAVKKKKIKKAQVTLKKLIWDGSKKVDKGTVFEDDNCFEGKYNKATADGVFFDEKSLREPKEPEEPTENDLSKIFDKS